MDFSDIAFGVVGFLCIFLIFALVWGVACGVEGDEKQLDECSCKNRRKVLEYR